MGPNLTKQPWKLIALATPGCCLLSCWTQDPTAMPAPNQQTLKASCQGRELSSVHDSLYPSLQVPSPGQRHQIGECRPSACAPGCQRSQGTRIGLLEPPVPEGNPHFLRVVCWGGCPRPLEGPSRCQALPNPAPSQTKPKQKGDSCILRGLHIIKQLTTTVFQGKRVVLNLLTESTANDLFKRIQYQRKWSAREGQ